MLKNLRINNIVLISSLDIEFSKGFCALTGETGAGKSILLDALSLALGERAESRLLKSGEKQGSVSAEFEIPNNLSLKTILEEHGIPAEENLLIIRRIIYEDGRSRAFINDFSVSAALLQQVAENLVEIHGQHEQSSLMNQVYHRTILDKFANLNELNTEVNITFQNWREAKKNYDAAIAEISKAKTEEDYLRFVATELSELEPKENEEENLSEIRLRLSNSAKINESLSGVLAELNQNKAVADSIRTAQRLLIKNRFANSATEKAEAALDRAANEVDEAINIIEKEMIDSENSPEELERIEDRLFKLRAAARKYNISISELPEYLEKIQNKLSLIDSKDEGINKLQEELNKAKSEFLEKAKKLSENRKKSAKKLEKQVEEELLPLKMLNCSFKVSIEDLSEENWSQDGIDKVFFVARTNPGSAFGPLNKIASGGELSRFMLALKVVLQEIKNVPTLIFDEIDSGISGAVSDAIGKRLAALGNKVQVFAITHQPQVAAYGKNHYLVKKSEKDGNAQTNVKLLTEKERREELARMLAGSKITDEARAAAKVLLEAK